MKNITWEIKDDTLFITGTGAMPDFDEVNGDCAEWIDKDFSTVIIEDGITHIGRSAFYDCRSLESITIPDSVKSIGTSAFENCKNLKSVVLPDSVKYIKGFCFTNCINLKDIVIPNGVKDIGDCAFSRCRSLKQITIPDSVKKIGNYALVGCGDVVIHTSKGSTAHRYAVDNDINVRIVSSLKKGNKNKGIER